MRNVTLIRLWHVTVCVVQGWSSWYAFGANINETKIVEMADAIVHSGLRDAG